MPVKLERTPNHPNKFENMRLTHFDRIKNSEERPLSRQGVLFLDLKEMSNGNVVDKFTEFPLVDSQMCSAIVLFVILASQNMKYHTYAVYT
jgi:hypothetical protein